MKSTPKLGAYNVSALGYMYKLNKVSAEARKERGRHYVYVFDKR